MQTMILQAAEIEILDYVARGGFAVFMLVAFYGGYRGWWVYGPTYKKCERSEEEWKNMALQLLQAADKATTVGERLVERNKVLREGKEGD